MSLDQIQEVAPETRRRESQKNIKARGELTFNRINFKAAREAQANHPKPLKAKGNIGFLLFLACL
jgi:hypothetical protein